MGTIVFFDISSVCQDSLASLASDDCGLFVDLRQFLVTAAVDDTAEGVQFTAQRFVRCPDTAACVGYPGNQTTLLSGLGKEREFDRFKSAICVRRRLLCPVVIARKAR